MPRTQSPAELPVARQRVLVLLIWASAYATYLLAYSGAVRLGGAANMADAILVGLTNSLPEALAAPLVLRLAQARLVPATRGLRALIALPALGIAFAAWSILGAAAGFALYRGLREGIWEFSLDRRNMAWKALFSLMVFALLAGVGAVRAYARVAHLAAARAERAETLRAEGQLAVLRAQLNPHFLFNVLHSLVGLAERDPALTASALERLGATLRYALRVQSQGIDRVTVREELAFVRDYLELERLRLGDRLATRFDVDDGVLDRVVPSFVLQPLVENAIRHGLAPRARGGTVAIRIADRQGGLALSVDDDGPPQPDQPAIAGGGSGVGLRLLRERIDAMYGQTASVVTGRSQMQGFRVEIRLPADEPPPAVEAAEAS